MPVQPSQQIVAELAPTGVLRAAINMGNFLLVTGKTPSGDPTGVSAEMAAAEKLPLLDTHARYAAEIRAERAGTIDGEQA